ncbi:septum site-determining protein MinC [Paenibacillus xylaniclasticus]|uniref:septum site-determining protein MinC n=1 Tax=Paenibacillus xylaniclasticus TaxID=588083 RepID=UPI000FDA1E5A|nr:septum site-determining protein MinC [Paenibacillus xylaniclasticus]
MSKRRNRSWEGRALTEKQHIIIKGVKEGLVFLLDDRCEFSALLDELQYKIEKTHQQLLTGPLIHVHVKLGNRITTEDEKEQIRSVLRQRGNLIVQSIQSEAELKPQTDGQGQQLKVMTGIIRSGQVVTHDGSLLLLGDLHPGGSIICTGDIYVMGNLAGMAHAGSEGNTDAIIAASLLRPTQLRIAEVISRPPEEWMTGDAAMEYAFLNEGVMQVDKTTQLFRMRKEPLVYKGV